MGRIHDDKERFTRVDRIELRAVTRTFGATVALRSVNATFEPGAIVFLQGPNGAGKSTLLAVLATVLRPTSGTVRYEPLGEDVALARSTIGWVAHESHCYPELTARQNVELTARLYGRDDSEWNAVLSRVGAVALAERSVGTLSRGQRQRIALARAIVHRPSVLLLDEPWSGLDATSSAALERVLVEERDGGTIVVVVSHDLDHADRLAGRTLRLENGKIVS